jgi:hypothetical protein
MTTGVKFREIVSPIGPQEMLDLMLRRLSAWLPILWWVLRRRLFLVVPGSSVVWK